MRRPAVRKAEEEIMVWIDKTKGWERGLFVNLCVLAVGRPRETKRDPSGVHRSEEMIPTSIPESSDLRSIYLRKGTSIGLFGYPTTHHRAFGHSHNNQRTQTTQTTRPHPPVPHPTNQPQINHKSNTNQDQINNISTNPTQFNPI